MSTKQQTIRPAHEVNVGFVKAVIWPNASTSGTRYNVTLTGLYGDGEMCKSTATFDVHDLSDVVRAVFLAQEWVHEHTSAQELHSS